MKKIYFLFAPALAVLVMVLLSVILFQQKSPLVQSAGSVKGPIARVDTLAASSSMAKHKDEQSVDSTLTHEQVQRSPLPANHKPVKQRTLAQKGEADQVIGSDEKTPALARKSEPQRLTGQGDLQTSISPKERVKKTNSEANPASLPAAAIQKVDSTQALHPSPALAAMADSIRTEPSNSQGDRLNSLRSDTVETIQPVASESTAVAQSDHETAIAALEGAKSAVSLSSAAPSGLTKVQEMQAPQRDHETQTAISMRTTNPIPLVEEAGIDQDQVYEDILNLVKSKISVVQHDDKDSSAAGKEVLLAANLLKRESVTPIKTKGLARHGLGIGFAAIKPVIGPKVTTPGSAEISYWYRAATRLQLQAAAGFTPLTWPGGKRTSMIGGDLVSHYLPQPQAKIQPMISIGLGMIRAKTESDNSINTSSLLAGTGIGVRISDQIGLSLQLQYKQTMKNLVRINSLKRDALISLKAELKFFPQRNVPSHQLIEENLVAEKD